MRPHDLLLTYLSELGRGSWRDLKAAHDWLFEERDDPAAKAWIAARDLAALGHIEVAWDRQIRWCAAPPLVTMLPRSGGRALITGGRTRRFEQELRRCVDERNLHLHEDLGQLLGPAMLLIACESDGDARGLASELGIEYAYSVADQLSAMLPPLVRFVSFFPAGELPHGFEAEMFDPAVLEWRPVSERDRQGLYRCRTFGRNEYALLDWDRSWRTASPEFAVYEVLRWSARNVLRYSESDSRLLAPARAGLPVLHGRAAVLCSGRLPAVVRDQGMPLLAYENVPLDVAERIASALSQALVRVEAL